MKDHEIIAAIEKALDEAPADQRARIEAWAAARFAKAAQSPVPPAVVPMPCPVPAPRPWPRGTGIITTPHAPQWWDEVICHNGGRLDLRHDGNIDLSADRIHIAPAGAVS